MDTANARPCHSGEIVVNIHARPSVGVLVACLLAGLFLVGTAPQASSAGSVEEAGAERERVQARLDSAARALADVETRVATLEVERDRLTARVGVREAEIAEIDGRMEDRIRHVYKHGTSVEPVAVFLASEDPGQALDRAGTVRRLVHGDRAEAEATAASRVRLRTEVQRLEQREEQLAAAVAEQQEVTSGLERALERASAVEERLRAEEQRRREREREQQAQERRQHQQQRAAQAATSETPDRTAPTGGSGMVCPIDRPRSFTDTWGAARSGGRQHRGTDILSPMGTPIRAITSGVWDIRSPGPSAGLWAILHGDNGNQYWYMHLQSHTVADGARVSAGQQTGTNGDTGNARGTPHLHFELHPGGGAAVNPYSLLRQVC